MGRRGVGGWIDCLIGARLSSIAWIACAVLGDEVDRTDDRAVV